MEWDTLINNALKILAVALPVILAYAAKLLKAKFDIDIQNSQLDVVKKAAEVAVLKVQQDYKVTVKEGNPLDPDTRLQMAINVAKQIASSAGVDANGDTLSHMIEAAVHSLTNK